MISKFNMLQNSKLSKIIGLICFCVFILPTLKIFYQYDITNNTNNFEYLPLTNMSMSYLINILVYLIPIIVTVPIAQYTIDYDRVSSFIYTRTNRKKELIQNSIISFIYGFSLTLVLLLTMYGIAYFAVNHQTNFFVEPVRNINFLGNEILKIPFYEWFINKPILFHSFYIVYMSVYAGLVSLLCFSMIMVFKKGYNTVIIIFGGSLAIYVLLKVIPNGISLWSPQNLVMADPFILNNPDIFTNELGKIVLIVVLIIFSVALIMYEIRCD